MSIINNRINDYNHLTQEELIKVIEDKYYEDEGTFFLHDKFYDDFKDHFNVSLNDFIDYVNENELFISCNLINEFFIYSIEHQRYLIKTLNDKSKEYIPV